MKKYYISCLALITAVINASSQITVTKSDMPQPNDTIRLSTTTNTAGLPTFSSTGANYTWNYSALVAQSQTIDTFLSVSSTPLLYQLYFNNVFFYPAYAATVAQAAPNPPSIPPITITNVINYYKATNADYENVGFGAYISSIPTSERDDTIDFIYRFPMNYGNSDSSNSSYHISVPSTFYYGAWQKRVNHVDGWGTLTTPYGTFQTLRVTTMLTTIDTIYIDTLHIGFSTPPTQQLQYKWLALGEKLPLLQINENVVFNVPILSSIVYRDSARIMPTSVVQINKLDGIYVYPNPAQNVIFIHSDKALNNTETTLYNAMGQQLMQSHINKLDVANPYVINMSTLSSGVYFLKISNNGNKVTYKVIKN